MRRIRRNWILLLAGTLVALASLPAAAEDILTIDFTGLELKFDGGNIYDDNATSLGSIEFYLNYGIDPVASLSGDVRADVLVQGVPTLLAGELAYSSGGYVNLLSGGNTLLGLSIGQMTVSYSAFGDGSIRVAGFASGIAGQSLPGGLVLDPGAVVRILLNGDALSGEHFTGGRLDGFTSSGGGTGEIEGQVPEPSSLILLLGLAASALAVRRYYGVR